MRRTFFALLVAGVAVAIMDARPEAQQNPLGQLLEKAKQKLQRPVECVETDQACIDKARRAGAPVKIVPAPPAPTPVAAGAAAPPPVTAGPGEFSGPVPTYQAMFKLLMAAHADVLGTDEFAAWDYYLIYRVPPNPTQYAFSPECSALGKRLGNEITAATVRAEAVADFKAALAQSSAAPRTGRFFLRTWEHFGPYDAARSAFPLERINSTLLGGGRIAVPRTPQGLISPEQSRQGAGNGTYCLNTQSDVARLVSLGFELELHGQEALKEFPMERAAAEAFVNANGDRSVAVEVVMETEPIQLSTGKPLVRTRITAARVLDKNTGRVLNTFTGLTPAPTTTTSTVALPTSGAVPYSGNRALLLTLRDHPELATQDALLDATRSQIGAEQQAWRTLSFPLLREVDLFLKRSYSGPHRWNPKRPTFFYEWQSIIDQQPDLARGPLLDIFMRPDADWSFVTREPAWDARFDAVVSVFLFSRDKIEGREPSFAAQELLPVYKRHLDIAITKAPTQFWFSVPLGFNYDFASKSLRLSGGMTRRRAESPDETDLLGSLPSEPEVALPESARGRAVYGIGGGTPTNQRSVPPGLALGPPSPADSWRSFATIGSSWRKIPLPGIVALDRRLKFDSIPMEPARAEQLVKAQTAAPGPSVLSARVYFDAERVDIGSTVIDRQREPAAVLLAKVQKIDIVDSANQVVGTIAGSALPAPVTRPSTPPAASAPVKTGPTPAEIETERRRKLDEQEAERSRRISERLNQQVQKQVKCATEASKVDGNTLSKAYQDAFAACMAK